VVQHWRRDADDDLPRIRLRVLRLDPLSDRISSRPETLGESLTDDDH
jgi:hypothetical protein